MLTVSILAVLVPLISWRLFPTQFVVHFNLFFNRTNGRHLSVARFY